MKNKIHIDINIFNVISGKWKFPIIVSLLNGNIKFNDIQKDLKGITARQLSKELKDLCDSKIVTRNAYSTVPVTVEYELTKLGKELNNVLISIYKWSLNLKTK